MKNILLTVLCFWISIYIASAQNTPTIKGKLVDSLSTEPLLYASVQLLPSSQTNL